jgi:hypothetical protein
MKLKKKLKYFFIALILFALSSNDVFAATTVSTQTVTNVNATYATANGTLDDTGGAAIIQHGFVWSPTDANPTFGPPVPTAEWKMNDSAANTTVVDSSGANTGTSIQNTSTMTTSGKINSAFNFNGASDYIYSTTQYSNPQSFSLSVWFKTNSASGKKIIGFENSRSGTGSSSYDRQIWIGTDGKAYFGWYTGSMTTIASQSTMTDGSWHQAVAILNAGSGKFYIDGQLQGTGSGNAQNYSGYWRVGSYKMGSWPNSTDGYFSGAIDDVRMYTSALSANDIDALYNFGCGTELSVAANSSFSKLGLMSGTGSFSAPLDGLLPNTNYYVRSYVTDSNGVTTYGSVVSFTTSNSGYATWTGGTSSAWNVGTNWSTGSVPDSSTEAIINGNGANAPTLDLSGGAMTIEALSVGVTNSSTLTVSNGDMSTKQLIVSNDIGIGGNGTITHTANTTSPAHFLNISAANIFIASGGQINADYKGYQGGSGLGKPSAQGANNGGGGYGGAGGSGSSYAGGPAYGSVTQPTDLGSGGGQYNSSYPSGHGGGAVKLTVSGTTAISSEGSISANGQDYQTTSFNPGGGSGGSVWLTTGTLAGSGTISANGGNGYSAGGGGGGRIAINYTTDSPSLSCHAYGGTGYSYGGAGTIYKKSTVQTNGGDLLIDNNSHDSWDDHYIGRTPINAAYTFDVLTIQNYGNLETGSSSNITYSTLNWSTKGIITDNGGTFLPENITIPATARLVGNTPRTVTGLTVSGTLTHSTNTTEAGTIYKLNYTVNGNLIINPGGQINADYKGYQGGSGPGKPIAQGSNNGGGGYGGAGGNGSSTAGGPAYGSVIQPTDLGSGGGQYNSGYPAGAGGGSIKIMVTGNATLDGGVSANGQNYQTISFNPGGGSGGSVWINTDGIFSGSGIISAGGGNGYSSSGGGGGGRIYITYSSSTATFTPTVTGGTGYNAGSPGTLRMGSLNGNLISSPFDSGSDGNVVSKIQWTETRPAGTTVGFQIRTASDSSGSPGAWSSWMGPTGTSDYFTDPTGAGTMNPAFVDGLNDRWVQYKAVLTSTDLSAVPSVSEVTFTYVVNASPQFDSSFGTNGVSIDQVSDSADSNWGKLKIQYAIEDPDATTGTATKNYVTPTFEYTLDGGTNWSDVSLENISFGSAPTGGDINDRNSDGKLDNKVLEGSYLTYTAYWNAKTEIPETYSNNVKIRMTVNDNEAANNRAQAIGNTTALDVKIPEVGEHPLLIDATTSPATAHFSSTDDSDLKMDINLTNTFSLTLTTDYADSATIALLADPNTVYAEFQDAFGNTTPVYSAATPETPTSMMIQDTSNMIVTPHEYRLFTAWKIADSATPLFAHYRVYRSSSENGEYELKGTSDARAANYFGDSTAQENQHYYYKVAMQDADGNISYFSSIVDGMADGVQDYGEGGGGTLPPTPPPVVSDVQISNITSTGATITWTTDVLSDSTVGFSRTPGSFTKEIGSPTMADGEAGVGQHEVVLTGLERDKTYYCKILSNDASNTEGTDDHGGNGYSFSTLDGPTISEVTVSQVTNNSATISWQTDQNSDTFVVYSSENDLSNAKEVGSPDLVGGSEPFNHEYALENLTPGATYHFYVKSTNASEDEAIDDNGEIYFEFTTTDDQDEGGPVIDDVDIPLITSEKGVIYWTTDEAATSKVIYGKTHTLSKGSSESVLLDRSHYIIITDLESDSKYYFKIISQDIYGNETTSDEHSFSTLKDATYQHEPLSAILNVSDPPSVVTDTKAVITWDTDQAANSTVEYGTISGSYNEVPVIDKSMDTHHSVNLAGLLPQTTYYFKVSSEDNLDNAIGSQEYSFATLPKQVDEALSDSESTPALPKISNVKKSSITASSVTITWSTDLDANSLVSYGLDDNYGSMAGDSLISNDSTKFTTSHSVIISGLLSNTSYHFQAVSYSSAGAIGVSGDSTFSTSAVVALSGLSVTNITLNSAVITWDTASPTSSVIDYGLTTKYGQTASDATNTNSHKIQLTNLTTGQTYHLRVNGINKKNASASIVSDDYVFATYAPPKLENYNVDDVTDNEAKLSWKTNVPTDSTVQYVDKSTGESGTQGVPDVAADHQLAVSSLQPGTEYEMKIIGTDVNKNNFTSNPFTLTTAQDTDPPQVSQVKTESSLITGKEDKVQSVIFWKTDESATSQVRFDEGIKASDSFSQESKEDDNLTTNHIIVLTNLKPGTVYHFTVVSKDASGNEAVSDNFTLLTPKKNQSVIQLIITNFEQTFGWMRKLRRS